MKNFNWTSLDEKWFSDKLNNLLTSRGAGHKFRTRFATKFIQKIYTKDKLANLDNSTSIREYPLNIIKTNKPLQTKFLDILFLDLDCRDNVVIGIENKFLTQNSKGQLEDYLEALNLQYPNYDVKMVYLTLDRRSANRLIMCENQFVSLSWKDDILEILLSLTLELNYDYDIDCLITQWSKKRKITTTSSEVIELINVLIDIYNLAKNDPPQNIPSTIVIDDFINHVKIKYKKNHKITTSDLGKYYQLKHGRNKVFIPKKINYEQASIMIEQFCIQIFDTKNITNNILNITSLENIFGKVDDNDMKIAIHHYIFSNNSNKIKD